VRLLLSLAYIVALPVAMCATFARTSTPGTRVSISPQLGIAPLLVQVRAAIDAPTEDWYCPSLTITWSDGTETKREADCEPWPDIPEHYRWAPDPIWRRLGPGRHEITVTLKQGAKSLDFPLWVEVSE
jgi:hypothetical protein